MKLKQKRLNRRFFARSAEKVAEDLLGKKIVRVMPDGSILHGIITETEAYVGVEDAASHSYRGRRTKRNEIMYQKAGLVYVYFTYGMHWLLNIVTSEENDPQAVLIRGIDKAGGPAKLTKYLHIDKDFYGEDVVQSERIWIEEAGVKIKDSDIERLPRVGIPYAGEWKDKLLRFKLVKGEK